MYHIIRAHGWFLALFALAGFVMLWRLDARPYVNFDEAIHGEVSLEMVERGNFLAPSYTNAPYFRKPPLKIWVTSTLMAFHPSPRGRGEGEGWKGIVWALRLPSALAGIGVVLLTAWWTWEWRRSRLAAFLAGAIMATFPAVHEHAFRTGEMDGMLTFFVLLALFAWWKTTCHPSPSRSPSPRGRGEGEDQTIIVHHPRSGGMGVSFWLAIFGVAMGLAVMTKSAAGLLPLPIIALHWFLYRKMIRISFRQFLVPCSVFLIITLPWHLAMTLLHGGIFWEEYMGWHVVHRVTTQLHNEGAGPLWYIGAFAHTAGPYAWWMLAVLIGIGAMTMVRNVQWFIVRHSPIAPLLALLRRHVPQTHRAMDRFEELLRWPTVDLLAIWWLTVFIGYSFAQTKFAWYLLPLFPATAMLIAGLTCIVQRATRVRRLIILLLLATVGLASVQTFHTLRREYPPSSFPRIIAVLREGRANGLVTYGFAWQTQPAAYFTLRAALPDVRISDGLLDVERTHEKLVLKERSWLLTKTETEIPEDLRARVGTPRHVDGWSLWERATP
ncbi:MAG: phospholipid carrier-dependent glycosyltransferase [bacterium]|nr:phospholipid carrier-dependent glycosyltransferase [bacterium]